MFWELSQSIEFSSLKLINSLDEFTERLYIHFLKNDLVDAKKLRDEMVKDRLSTNNTGAIPEILKIHSKLTKKVLLHLEKDEKTKKPKNVKRAISLLSDCKKAVYVDYIECNPVTKQYKLCEIDIEDI